MSIQDPPPLPNRRSAGTPAEPVAPAAPAASAAPHGLSADTIRGAVMYARERLEDDLVSFVVFDRFTGEAVFNAASWPEGNNQLFQMSQRIDARLPVEDELSAVREWWMLDLPVDKRLVVFLNMGERHRGVMIVDNTYGRVAKVFGNVVPALLMRCREGW